MSHKSQNQFVSVCASLLKNEIPAPKVVEIGSYYINGSVREHFQWSSGYVGVDLIPGQGVDAVASGHEYGKGNSFDIAVSCECFEHNPYWLETFVNMIRLVKPGGCVIFTCATTGRPEHGTDRSDEYSNPGGLKQGWHYYCNLTRRDFCRHLVLKNHFDFHRFFTIERSQDLLFFGIKKQWGNQAKSKIRPQYQKKIGTQLTNAVGEIKRNLPPKPREYPLLSHINEAMLYLIPRFLGDRVYQNFRFKWNRIVKSIVKIIP